MSFPDFPIFRIRTTRLTSVAFYVPVIPAFVRLLPIRTIRLKICPFHVPVISGSSGIFDFFRLVPPVSKLFPCMILSCPDFPDFPIFSDSYHPSHNCSISCSCHARIFWSFRFFLTRTTRLNFFSIMLLAGASDFSTFSDVFRICPAVTKV